LAVREVRELRESEVAKLYEDLEKLINESDVLNQGTEGEVDI
jgi:hypothetical protein